VADFQAFNKLLTIIGSILEYNAVAFPLTRPPLPWNSDLCYKFVTVT
jgi:hypothetical protein